MNDLQILILTLFLGLFGLLVNYLVKFFRSAVKSAEESQVHENEDSNEQSRQVIADNMIMIDSFNNLKYAILPQNNFFKLRNLKLKSLHNKQLKS